MHADPADTDDLAAIHTQAEYVQLDLDEAIAHLNRARHALDVMPYTAADPAALRQAVEAIQATIDHIAAPLRHKVAGVASACEDAWRQHAARHGVQGEEGGR